MRPHLIKLFTEDDRAVAPLIGFILLFGILSIAFAGYQAERVPQQNAETEFQHYQDVQNDLVVVRNAILRAGQQDQSQFESVRLGTSYRERILALNPPDPTGTLRTSDSYPVTIEQGEIDGERTPIEASPIPTRFLTYQNGYNELEVAPIQYDNSVLYLSDPDGDEAVVFEEQNLVQDNGDVVLTTLQNPFDRSATGRVTIELYPTASDPATLPDGPLTITIPTKLSADYWTDALDETALDEANYNVLDATEAYSEAPGVRGLELQVTAGELVFNTVGIDDVPEETSSISYTPDESPQRPELSASLDIMSLPGNGKYELDASGSNPSGDINEYRWDFDNDGSIDRTTTSATTTVNNGNKDVDDTGSARVVVVNTDTSPSTTSPATEPYPFSTSGDVTVQEGQTITRDIDTNGDVEVNEGGEVQGSIDSGGNVDINEGGEVQGSIDSGGNVDINEGGEVQGPVTADGAVTIADVTGSITAGGDVVVNEGGEVQGSINSGGDVTVKEGGEVQGSVDADGEVTVNEGGKVQGEISEG